MDDVLNSFVALCGWEPVERTLIVVAALVGVIALANVDSLLFRG